jgi:hypothetical protein
MAVFTMSDMFGFIVAKATPSLKAIPMQVVPLLTASFAYSIQAEQHYLLCYLEQAAVRRKYSYGSIITHLNIRLQLTNRIIFRHDFSHGRSPMQNFFS